MQELIDRYARKQFKIKDDIIYLDYTMHHLSTKINDVFNLDNTFSFYRWLEKNVGEVMCVKYDDNSRLYYYHHGTMIPKEVYDARTN